MAKNKEQIPKLVNDTIRLVMSMPANFEWRRIRIAVTDEEFEEIAQFYGQSNNIIAQAIRGIPLIIEEEPNNHSIIVWFLGKESK